MKFEPAALRSRVARRLLLVFVAGSLVPIGVLAAVVYMQMTEQLREQSERRLHDAARTTGLALLESIQELDSDLAAHAAELSRPGAASNIERIDEFTDRVEWLVAVEPDRVTPLLGTPAAIDTPAAGAMEHLMRGRALLSVTHTPGRAPTILLRRRVEPDGPAQIIAALRPDHLFDFSPGTTLPPLGEYCILDAAGAILHCSLADVEHIPDALLGGTAGRNADAVTWEHGGTSYFAHEWSFYIAPQYGTRQWTVVVAEPRAVALAPVARFRTTFLLGMLGSCLLVSYIVLVQIRQRLAPLDLLRAGTERIARQDFSQPIEIPEREDEFAVVARSLNTMTRHLDAHVRGLSRLIEIDRTILAAADVDELGHLLAQGVRDLHPCAVVAVLLIPPGEGAAVRGFLARDEGADVIEYETAHLPAIDPACWNSSAGPQRCTVNPNDDPSLRRLARDGVNDVQLYPLPVDSRLAGVIACGYSAMPDPDDHTLTFVERLADQALQALRNAHILEQKRVLAYYDSLTGLPNRLTFRDRFEQDLSRVERSGGALSLLLLDLDRFKQVNDTLGHAEGDALLCDVTRRLQAKLRAGTLARIGGDEFTVIVRDSVGLKGPARAAEVILEQLAEPFEILGKPHSVSASIGIAVYPNDGRDLDTLLRNADAAMYAAKADGGARFRLYTPALHERAVEQMELESELREAIAQSQLSVHYQPIVDCTSRRIISAEALVRWQHPERGMIPPATFIPLAEETGLILDIGEQVLRQACADNAEWQRRGLPKIRVSVNVSSKQVIGSDLLSTVRRALVDHQLYPRYLGLELTETSAMRAEEQDATVLHELNKLGITLAMDDFGTGYSSLGYLRRFPCDHLKIDQCFIRDMEAEPDARTIVRTILAMARNLNLSVVAEGVETEAQFEQLREYGCDAIQGFLISRPVPAETFEKLLRESGEAEEAHA